ncbi:MAG: hypothetical protein FJX64_07290 [Alphaproteobacteria bacterium]|nr:hypothetical protein [Alphaproteobacteria bacterium]
MAGKAGSHQTNPPKVPRGRADQRERLSDALRANLRKRKEQARERPADAEAPRRPTLIGKTKA